MFYIAVNCYYYKKSNFGSIFKFKCAGKDLFLKDFNHNKQELAVYFTKCSVKSQVLVLVYFFELFKI